ncbi:MAG: uracil-DNA glycosylase [Janthinobacterium lividum]
MTGPSQTVTRAELGAALGWLVHAGVDTVVGDTPFNWLAGPIAAVAPEQGPAATTVAAEPPRAGSLAIGADSLAALAAALAEFDARPAGILPMPPLFADGDAASGVMLVGDRPSLADAAAGRVFGDTAGELLDRMLAAIGRSRGSAYLANLVAWPTPADRASTPAEIAAAAPFVRRQIQLARPRAILALGQAAATALCGTTQGIARLRGQWQTAEFDGLTVPVMPTFHPTHLLRHPAHKAMAWLDLCSFKARIDA